MVDPTGLDTWIRYKSGYIAKYSSENWPLAVEALIKADAYDNIDTVDFFGHGGTTYCGAGTWDNEVWQESGGLRAGNGGIRYDSRGLRIFWIDSKNIEHDVTLRSVLAGKKIRKVRYFSCNSAGGTADWQDRQRRDPEHAYAYIPPTDDNIAYWTAKVLAGDGTVVEGAQGVYIFAEDNAGNPIFTNVLYWDPKPYKNPK
jgi:hypothetical protein